MDDNTVPSGGTAILKSVEGDLEVGRHATIKGEKVTVLGTVYCEGNCAFEGSLSAENLEGEDDITVNGDLEIADRISIEDGHLIVQGSLKAKRVEVDHGLRVGKDFEVEEVDVGGSLKVEGNTIAEEIEVGGTFEAEGTVKAET